MKKLQADIINGIQIVDDFDDNTKILSQVDFDLYLDILKADTVIGCEADEAMITKLGAEYGIS